VALRTQTVQHVDRTTQTEDKINTNIAYDLTVGSCSQRTILGENQRILRFTHYLIEALDFP